MKSYTPEEAPIGGNIEDLVAYLRRELLRISGAFQYETIVLKELHNEPAKPSEGELANADGTDWNPGHGAGIYVYLNGTWNKITHGN